jgi:streptogramin lyase
VGDAPDLVLVAGGYVWITHYVLRDGGSGEDSEFLRDAGDRTLTRLDPSTGDAEVVGGGLAPCGLTADPSGDVWVANCFKSGSGPGANVVRIDASTLRFEATWSIPAAAEDSFFRGITYGGGALWVSAPTPGVVRIDPRTGGQKVVRLDRRVGALAWSEGYGDLWMNSFALGSVSRMHAATEEVRTVESVARNPVSPEVDGDAVWVGDWSLPQVVRLNAVGPSRPRPISLPVTTPLFDSAVWSVAAGAGAVWATTPRDSALWRIDPTTNQVTRISIPYLPAGVATGDNDVWVTVRAN